MKDGTTPTETRGGPTKSPAFKIKRESVKRFLEDLKPLQSHYCRSKNIMRHYLGSDLTIQKLLTMFNVGKDDSQVVKYEFFRSIFVNEYNIGFGSPATDCCSTCLRLEEQIKRNSADKQQLQLELAVHKQRAEAFYNSLKEPIEGELFLSFDCQKNLVLPRVADQAAYYSRQAYMYNFTICRGHSKAKRSTENTYCYAWTENIHAKGSNEVGSAIYHCLSNIELGQVKVVRLFSDGCGGQNKNSTIIGMLAKWLHSVAPKTVEQIVLSFPIVGHSFLPPDRVFGVIEKKIRAKGIIVQPEEYIDIFKSVATTFNLGSDCPVYDWKATTKKAIKLPGAWHFAFQKSKRIVITRSNKGTPLIRGEPNYNFDVGEPKSILKKNGTYTQFKPVLIPVGSNKLKEAKLQDIQNLLKKHFGEEWEELEKLQFYRSLMQVGQKDDPAENSGDDDFNDLAAEEENVLQL